jgi:molecular chaperone DnaK
MAVGIDFGTTNSAVVYNRNQLLDESDELPFPSVVAIDPLTGHTKVGHEARKMRNDLANASWNVVSSVKLALSHDRALAQSRGRKLNSTEISAMLLSELKKRAEGLFGSGKADEAVISIPVDLRADARRRVRKAAEMAGIRILEFVSEPTAAFISCREDLPQSERVVVFDWGGGTLDVSVLQIEGGAIHELATRSIQKAGDSIDEILARHIHSSLTTTELDRARVPAKHYDKLLVEAESAKRALSEVEETQVFLPGYLGKDYKFRLTRADLAQRTSAIVSECVECTQSAVEAARRIGGDAPIDHVVLVGGSSRLYGLRNRLEQEFVGVDVFVPRRPQWSVAQGASILVEELTRGHNSSVYRLNHPVYLVLSDGSLLAVVREGDAFDDRFRRFNLAVVEDTNHAQLVFAVPDGIERGILDHSRSTRTVDCIAIPIQGLPFEQVRVDAKLTRELTLAVRAQTEKGKPHRDDHWSSSWEYEKLLFSYNIPSA